MRIEVLVNPLAGRRRFRYLAGVLDALRARAGAVRVHETRWRGDAEAYAREAASRADVDRLVVAGGDGTIGEAVNGLAGAALPLGVIPLGTANVLARELELPRGAMALATMLAGGVPRRVSTGLVNGRRFVMMASAGLDAEVVRAVDPRLKRVLGKGAYALTTLRLALARRPARYAVTVTAPAGDAASVLVGAAIAANGRHYGGGFVVAPDAALDRAEFRLVTARGSGAAAQLRYGAALLLGRLPRLADVSTRTATRLTIEGPEGAPVQADGDLAGELPATIEIDPDSLTLVFPR